jgi:hypothetical protein
MRGIASSSTAVGVECPDSPMILRVPCLPDGNSTATLSAIETDPAEIDKERLKAGALAGIAGYQV